MKKCKDCKFFLEFDNDDNYKNLCLYLCESRTNKDNCLSEKSYIEGIEDEYNRLKDDLENLFKQMNSDSYNYHLFSYWNSKICDIIYRYGMNNSLAKWKIIEYIEKLKNEIEMYKRD